MSEYRTPPNEQELSDYRAMIAALMTRCQERVRAWNVPMDALPHCVQSAPAIPGGQAGSASLEGRGARSYEAASEPWTLGVAQIARAIAARELTATRVVESLLARIDAVDPQVQAWVRVIGERAISEAAALDRGAAEGALRGPLHGVPVGIKDIVYTAGIETNVGSPLLAGFVPREDAPLVRRLRAAGAIILGKTAMTEFASMDPAPTRNPWNLEHTPGGSSSGSAAAVAAFLAPATVGSQTAGSILRPAAYCGVVGLKPTYDAIEREGVFPCAWSMDHLGPFARSVDDAARLYRAMARAPGRSSPAAMDARAVRIGIADRYFDANVDADTRAAFAGVLQKLRHAGAQLVKVRLPQSFEAGVDAGIITVYAEMAAVHRQRYASERARYGWRLACLLDAGGAVSASDYLRAQQMRAIAAGDLSALLADLDCLITPATPAPAPHGLALTGDWTHNMPFSSSGHPALAVPIALSTAGLPIGAQLAARYYGEEQLFRCGALVESVAEFPYARRL